MKLIPLTRLWLTPSEHGYLDRSVSSLANRKRLRAAESVSAAGTTHRLALEKPAARPSYRLSLTTSRKIAVVVMNTQMKLCFIAALFACGSKKTWVGYAYPDRSDLSRYEVTRTDFATEADCMAQTEAYLRRRLGDNWRDGDLECSENDN